MTELDLAAAEDTYHVDCQTVRDFIAEVLRIVEAEPDRARTVGLLRPAFAKLLSEDGWLPGDFARPDATGGMGAGVGNYLIYRSAQRDLSLMSLVLAPDTSTPVHDHLAWGLVGLYRGEQEERVYRRIDPREAQGEAHLEEIEVRYLNAGDFYELLPPEGDIHEVRTVGSEASVSIHLLGNDIGCTWRHRYEPAQHRVYDFRSGYSNEPCDDGQEEATS